MTDADLLSYQRLLQRMEFSHARSVLLVSPWLEQYRLWRRACPSARIYCSSIATWDLGQPKQWTFDVIFVANVMLHSSAPGVWLDNLLRCCRRLVIQDVIDRQRGGESELGGDGDLMRYSFSAHGISSSYAGAYDLSKLSAAMRYLDVYPDGNASRHFCAVFEGSAGHASNNVSALLSLFSIYFPVRMHTGRLASRIRGMHSQGRT